MLWKCTFSGVWLLCKSDIFEEFECFLNEYSQEAYCLPCFGCPPHPLPRGGSRPCWDDNQHKRGEPAHPNHLLFAKVGPLIIIGPVLLVAGASLLFCSCEICSRWRFGFWFRHSDTVSALHACCAKVNVTNVAGCGNKRREWWTQAYSKPKTCTKWNIGLNQVFAIVTLLINHPTITNWTRSLFQFETYQPWKYTQLEELVENFFSALNIDWKPFYQFWHLKSWHFKQCDLLQIDTLMVILSPPSNYEAPCHHHWSLICANLFYLFFFIFPRTGQLWLGPVELRWRGQVSTIDIIIDLRTYILSDCSTKITWGRILLYKNWRQKYIILLLVWSALARDPPKLCKFITFFFPVTFYPFPWLSSVKRGVWADTQDIYKVCDCQRKQVKTTFCRFFSWKSFDRFLGFLCMQGSQLA